MDRSLPFCSRQKGRKTKDTFRTNHVIGKYLSQGGNNDAIIIQVQSGTI